jgi:hypothetical protein
VFEGEGRGRSRREGGRIEEKSMMQGVFADFAACIAAGKKEDKAGRVKWRGRERYGTVITFQT